MHQTNKIPPEWHKKTCIPIVIQQESFYIYPHNRSIHVIQQESFSISAQTQQDSYGMTLKRRSGHDVIQ